MRIAVSGTHITGKSTLVEALAERLPDHTIVPEPYEVLAERGYEFAHPPEVADYIVQLRQSLISLRRSAPNRIFDRCPLDFLAYIAATPGGERFDLDVWREPIMQALASIDLVVVLHADPAVEPAIPAEEAAFRQAVDAAVWEIIDSDGDDLCEDVDVLSLTGPWHDRVEQVLSYIQTRTS